MYRVLYKKGFPYRVFPKNISKEMTVYQETGFLKTMYRNLPIYSIPRHLKTGTFVVQNGDDPVLIFPALSNEQFVELAGNNQGTSSLSPVFFENEESNLPIAMSELFAYFSENRIRSVSIHKIPVHSSIYSLITQGVTGWNAEVDHYDNVKIDFPQGYDFWYSNLTKSVRQNIRTAYNRMNTDGKAWKVLSYRGGEIPRSMMRKLVSVYNDRHSDHYGIKTSFLKRFYMQHFDFSTRDLFRNPKAIHYVLLIDGAVAAFFNVYVDRNSNSIFVLRLSINAEFGRYSPGCVLLNEAINDCCKRGIVNCIDLLRGVEKYKLDMGGTVYKKANIKMTKAKPLI